MQEGMWKGRFHQDMNAKVLAYSQSLDLDWRLLPWDVAGSKAHARGLARIGVLTPDEAETLVGHAVGGVCPFGIKDGVEVYLDESLKRFSTVYPACGSSSSAIELTIPELEKYSGFACWVDVCKNWQS